MSFRDMGVGGEEVEEVEEEVQKCESRIGDWVKDRRSVSGCSIIVVSVDADDSGSGEALFQGDGRRKGRRGMHTIRRRQE